MESALRVIRIANGFKETDLADIFNTTKQNIHQIEWCVGNLRKGTLDKYCKLFNISMRDLQHLISYAKTTDSFKDILLKYLNITRDSPSTCYASCNTFKAIRLFENLTIGQVARKTGLKSDTVSCLESKKRKTSIGLIEIYAKTFCLRKVDLVYLIEQNENGASITDIMWLYNNLTKSKDKGEFI